MDDGVKIVETTETPVKYGTRDDGARGKPYRAKIVHTLAWCECGWESPPTSSETRATRHLLVHRWLEHDGPELPGGGVPKIYRKRAEELGRWPTGSLVSETRTKL